MFVSTKSTLRLAAFAVILHSGVIVAELPPIPTIPTSKCAGNPVGTATWTSDLSVPTGEVLWEAGAYWGQYGAVYEFSTDTEDIELGGVGIPGYGADGDIPKEAEDAFKVNANGKTVTFSVPISMGGGFEWQFQATASGGNGGAEGASGSSSTAKLTAKTTSKKKNANKRELPLANILHPRRPAELTKTRSCAHAMITEAPRGSQNDIIGCPVTQQAEGAEELRKRQAPRSLSLKISANSPCLKPTPSVSVGSKNPTIASLCNNGQITPNAAAWTDYEVSSYMKSLLSSHAVTQNHAAFADGASVIQSDVVPAKPKPTYSIQAENIDCTEVVNNVDANELTVQRFLGYNAVVNYNNYMYQVYDAFYKAGVVAALDDDSITVTYFTDKAPDATWEQMVGVLNPLLGAFASIIGPIFPIASAALSAISSLISTISASGVIGDLAPVVDQDYRTAATIKAIAGDYLKKSVNSIAYAYDHTIGPDTPDFEWTGTDVVAGDATGLFGAGVWTNQNKAQGLSTSIQNNIIKIFTYGAINYAWKQSGVFIMYIPYDHPVVDGDGNYHANGIDSSYCHNSLADKDNIGTLLLCDGPSNGMAFITTPGNGNGVNLIDNKPTGWDSDTPLPSGEKLSVASVIEGSIASWKAGNFNYNASDPYTDLLKGSDINPSSDTLSSLASLQISQSAPGWFNIPVCQLYDVRWFPPYQGNNKYKGCTACWGGAGSPNVGGKGDGVFKDSVPSSVSDLENGYPLSGASGGGIYESICTQDLYEGGPAPS